MPTKRKRGRPRKEDEVVIKELLQASSESIPTDHQIIILMKKLNSDQKQILLNYIHNLREWKDPLSKGGDASAE